jgi:hypothetical protein
MKYLKKALAVLVLFAQGSAIADCASTTTVACDTSKCCDLKNGGDTYGKNFFAYRPVDSNAARGLVGVADKMHLFGKEEFYGQASVSLSWQQTYNSDNLAKWFSFNGKNSMTYGNLGDGKFDINGLQFGTTSSGSISFAPRIQNFTADIDLYFGWDEFVCGLWSRVRVPVVYTRWDMRASDTVTGAGGKYYECCNVDNIVTGTTEVVYSDLKSAWAGGDAFGKVGALACGKICGSKNTTAIAGVHFDLGYDFIRKERGHFGVSLHSVAPSGTTPSADYMFNAVAGANNSWQIGGSVNAAYEMWNDCDGDKRLCFFLDAYVTHLFDAKQKRLMGLKNAAQTATNPGSAYMVLKKFSSAAVVDVSTPLVRVADVLCSDVKVRADIMADIALMLQYDSGNYSLGLGWNFWYRSREKMKERPSILASTYGISDNADAMTDSYNGNIWTTTTASESTIGKIQGTAGTTTVGGTPTVDSTNPTFLVDGDVDECSALHPNVFTNKVFGFVGYNWKDCEWQPFVSVFGGVEFGDENKAADQWEVGVKGGIAF